MLFIVSVASAQTKKRVDSTQVVPLDTATSFLVLNSNGATRRLAKSAIQGQIDNINGVLPLKANAANVDTAKANIRSEMSSHATYSEANYQKITAYKTSNNVAYVSKKYTTAGDADWILQKNTAEVGNPIAPYPNPWLAMAAISAKLVSKEIEKGLIIVLEGNVYRTAENTDTAGLTGLDYVYRANGSYYHPFPSTTSRTDDDSLCFSLLFPNLDIQFGKGAGIKLVIGRGNLVSAYDTIAPQRISGFGTFDINYNNDRTNSGNGIGTNVTLGGGYSKGVVEFSGDSLIVKRDKPSYSGWVSLNTGSSALFSFNFDYVSTFENNNLFRGYTANYNINRLVIDTVSLPYMYVNAIYSPSGIFYPNGGNIKVNINEAIIASNQIVFGNLGSSIFKINRIVQKYRSTYQTDLIGTNADNKPQGIGPAGKSSSVFGWFYINSAKQNPYIEVNSYRGQAPILVFEDGGSITNTNARFVFHNVFQDSILNGSITPKTSIYVKHTGTSTNNNISIYANIINDATSAVVIEGNSKVRFEGTYKTNSLVKPAITVNGTNTNTLFYGSAIVNGVQSSFDGSASSTLTCLPSATANTAVSSNVTVTGTLSVNAAYKQ